MGLYITLATAVYAQPEVIGLPVQWAQYLQALPLVNPASAGTEGDVEFNIGNQRPLGLWRNNQTYYANANFRLLGSRSHAHQFHTLGAAFVGEKEGHYLRRNRAYVLYAYHLKLSESFKLSAGTSLGMANFVAATNDFNGGGSATAPDGNVGIWLRSDRFYFGIGHHQIFQGKLRPIWETTLLKRYWSLTTGKTFVLGPWLDFKLAALARIVAERKPDLDLNASMVIQQVLLAGAVYRHQKGLAFVIGLEKIKINNSIIKGSLSYQIPLFAYAVPNIQGIEIALKYILNKKQEVSGADEDNLE